ncbi:MAG TPA: hypothetical protein DCP92_12585 [Nitrospiraceae bacterium]|nr:hypothetical protein [Nitrospiraceae bacterium]
MGAYLFLYGSVLPQESSLHTQSSQKEHAFAALTYFPCLSKTIDLQATFFVCDVNPRLLSETIL